MKTRSTLMGALAAAALAAALLTLPACSGVQTQKGEPETPSKVVTGTPAPGSEEVQPPAGEEESATEQPGATPPASP